MAGPKKPPARAPVVPSSWLPDVLAAPVGAPPPPVAAPPRVAPVAGAAPPSGDLALARRILSVRDPSALAELDAGLVEASKGPAELSAFLARPIARPDAPDPLDAASAALAAAAAFVESLPPNDRRAATLLNTASTLAKTVETISSRRPREPTRDEVEDRIAARRDEALKKICEYTDEAHAKLDANRAELDAWARSNLGPMIADELARRVGAMLGEVEE